VKSVCVNTYNVGLLIYLMMCVKSLTSQQRIYLSLTVFFRFDGWNSDLDLVGGKANLRTMAWWCDPFRFGCWTVLATARD